MKVKFTLLVFSLCCLIMSGCFSEETKDEKAQSVMQNDDSRSYVSEADLKNKK